MGAAGALRGKMGTRIIIVGGVAGGATAAARLRRLDEEAEIIVLERGSDVSFANCGLPYHIGGEIAAREALLVQTKAGLTKRFRLDIRTRSEALRIDRELQTVWIRDLESDREYSERYDFLLLSPGATPLVPPLKGVGDVDFYTLRTMGDMDRINARITAGARSALIVGAGYIGIELAENLRRRGLEVKLLDRLTQVMPLFDPEIARRIEESLGAAGVQLLLGAEVEQLLPDQGRVRAQLRDGSLHSADLLIFAAGVKPDTRLAAESGLVLSEQGAIVVDERMRSSDPLIYAVGDAVQLADLVSGGAAHVPLAGPANRQARIAADNICGRDSRYSGAQGTSILRVFDITAGMTGASEKRLKQRALPYRKVYVHRGHHVGYFPGAQQLTLKLLFEPGGGRVLGAQVVGAEGVDKRLDVLATAIRARMTVRDLQLLELAYAPQFGAAKDPINIAGDAAAHLLDGDDEFVEPEELLRNPQGWTVIDVREPAEHQAGHIPGSVLLPLGEIRTRWHEIPREKPVAVYCAVGQRGYYASRILRQKGLPARNLNGGFTSYRTFASAEQPQEPRRAPQPPSTPRPAGSAIADDGASERVQQLDLRGLQCPGPLACLADAAKRLPPGTRISAVADDQGFAADLKAWCSAGGHELTGIEQRGRELRASIVLQQPGSGSAPAPSSAVSGSKTLVVFSGELDRVLAAFVIANAAADLGDKVTMFFTFWGLNALRRAPSRRIRKPLLDAMFGWMMPRGASRLKLSKLHMAGIGTALMRKVMRDKRVADLPAMITQAQSKGVRIVVCTMSMNVMGLQQEELIEGVEFGGAAAYLAQASQSGVNLFI